MIHIGEIEKLRFGEKAARQAGVHVRAGHLNFDIRLFPALALRAADGRIGGVIFHESNRLRAARDCSSSLDEALVRFDRAGVSRERIEIVLIGGAPTNTWLLDAWRTALRERRMRFQERDTGESYYRQIFFDVAAGRIDLFREVASGEQGNPGKASLSLSDSTQVFRESDARGVVANATRFFREEKTFRALREWIVPEHLERRPGAPFLLWSACCSNGAESYSYAMYLHRLFRHLGAALPMRVVGTDINEGLLETARSGRYRVKPDEWRKFRDYFDEYADTEADEARFRDDIKRFVTFRVHDIKRPPRRLRFQVIICANVFQYYKDDAREHFLRNFASALESPGYLYTGAVRPELVERAGLQPLGRYGMYVKP